MIEFLDDLELNQVSELSGVKPVTIKQWIWRGQLDAPPIDDWQYRRQFQALHVLEVLIMRMLGERGVPARKAGPLARQLAPEAETRLEAGESYDVDGLPLSGVLNPYFARCRRAKAAHEKRKAEWRAEMDASIARARANWERYGYPKRRPGRPFGSLTGSGRFSWIK